MVRRHRRHRLPPRLAAGWEKCSRHLIGVGFLLAVGLACFLCFQFFYWLFAGLNPPPARLRACMACGAPGDCAHRSVIGERAYYTP